MRVLQQISGLTGTSLLLYLSLLPIICDFDPFRLGIHTNIIISVRGEGEEG